MIETKPLETLRGEKDSLLKSYRARQEYLQNNIAKESQELAEIEYQITLLEGGVPSYAPHNGKLSPREKQILQALVNGNSNKEISCTCIIAESTVKAHIRSILFKLNAKNRAQAAAMYQRMYPVSQNT